MAALTRVSAFCRGVSHTIANIPSNNGPYFFPSTSPNIIKDVRRFMSTEGPRGPRIEITIHEATPEERRSFKNGFIAGAITVSAAVWFLSSGSSKPEGKKEDFSTMKTN